MAVVELQQLEIQKQGLTVLAPVCTKPMGV